MGKVIEEIVIGILTFWERKKTRCLGESIRVKTIRSETKRTTKVPLSFEPFHCRIDSASDSTLGE